MPGYELWLGPAAEPQYLLLERLAWPWPSQRFSFTVRSKGNLTGSITGSYAVSVIVKVYGQY
jgi:hypothetical protein